MENMKICGRGVLIAAVFLLATSAGAATYYVDIKNPLAADTNPGTENEPFRTIQKAANTATAGDEVIVFPGDYNEAVIIASSGAPGNPIIFRGLNKPDVSFPDGSNADLSNPSQTSKIRGVNISANYIAVENFEFTKISPQQIGAIYLQDANYAAISSNYFHELNTIRNCPRGPTTCWGAVRGSGNNVNVKNNVIWRVEGIGITVSGSNWLVENNDVSHGNTFAWDYAKSALASDLNGALWDTNYWVSGDTDALRFFGTGHIIRGNYFHDFNLAETGWKERKTQKYPNPAPHMDCFQTFSNGGPPIRGASNILIENNTCHNIGTQMAMISDISGDLVHHITFRNNIFWKSGAYALNIGQTEYLTVENNLFAESYYGAIALGGNSRNATIINNIIYYDYRIDNIARNDPVFGDIGSMDGLVLNNNLHYPSTKRTLPSYDLNGLFGTDPLFVNPSHGDFHIRDNSPAIDRGADLSAKYAYDKDGTARPQGAGWDIGPFEFHQKTPARLPEGDSDLDGIPDTADRCPKTASIAWGHVNIFGCAIPIADKFDIRPDFNTIDITGMPDLELEVFGLGKINYANKNILLVKTTNGEDERINIDADMDILQNKIVLNQNTLPQLNQAAAITLYNINFTRPKILKNGAECTACQISGYDRNTKTITFHVPGFS